MWEAARIDGAGHPRFLISVVLPLSKAPIMTIVTLGFIGSWNALMWPLLVTINDEWRPIAVGLSNFVTADTPGDLNLQMAASVITVIPILVLYFMAQKAVYRRHRPNRDKRVGMGKHRGRSPHIENWKCFFTAEDTEDTQRAQSSLCFEKL